MKLYAHVMEGKLEGECFQADCSQDGYNELWNLGKSMWDGGTLTKYEIGVFTDEDKLFWSIRPDKNMFSENRLKTTFLSKAKEEYQSVFNDDFQQDPVEVAFLQQMQTLWEQNPSFISMRDSYMLEKEIIIEPEEKEPEHGDIERDFEPLVPVIRAGDVAIQEVPFSTIKTGDQIFLNGKAALVGESAHYSGDTSYDGYLLYTKDGESVFPEDLDDTFSNHADTKEEGKMNHYPSKEIVERLREQYPVGCRVELTCMDDVQAPPIGTKGTVRGVDDIGSILVGWDNGSSLNVVYGADSCRVVEREMDVKKEAAHPSISEIIGKADRKRESMIPSSLQKTKKLPERGE